jgi:hypothetical protein
VNNSETPANSSPSSPVPCDNNGLSSANDLRLRLADRDSERSSRFHIFDPDRLIKPANVYFEGFLEAEEMAVWLGREKSRKSSVILQFAFCAALGKPFFGLPFVSPRPLKVTIFDYESKEASMSARYNALVEAMDLDAEKQQHLKRIRQLAVASSAHRPGTGKWRTRDIPPADRDKPRECSRQPGNIGDAHFQCHQARLNGGGPESEKTQ